MILKNMKIVKDLEKRYIIDGGFLVITQLIAQDRRSFFSSSFSFIFSLHSFSDALKILASTKWGGKMAKLFGSTWDMDPAAQAASISTEEQAAQYAQRRENEKKVKEIEELRKAVADSKLLGDARVLDTWYYEHRIREEWKGCETVVVFSTTSFNTKSKYCYAARFSDKWELFVGTKKFVLPRACQE